MVIEMAFTMQQLKSLVKQGESDLVEFKKTTARLNAIFETVCGFLNNKGGVVLIGVTDKGELVGQDVTDSTRREIANELRKIEPPVEIEIGYVPIKDHKKVIFIKVLAGKQAPYTYDSRPYQREQSVTKRMPQQRHDQLIAHRFKFNFAWEEFEAKDYRIDDLNQELIFRIVRQAVEMERMPEEALRQSISKILEALELSRENQLNNAAVVLFGKEMQPHYSQCQLKMARFKGTDRSEFMDSDLIHANCFQLLEMGMLFIRRHLPVAARIEPGKLQRVETPLIPYDAIREALINALCHRDYAERGGCIGLAIYDDRMEIFSHGGLLPGVTIEKIKSGFSKPRNYKIADVFYRCRLVEKWGRGIPKIIASCKKGQDPEPEFFADNLEFKVIFKFPASIKPPAILMAELSEKLLNITGRQREILEILSNYRELKMKEILAQLKNPPAERTLRDDLAALKALGIIKSQGHAKTSIWSLVNS